MRPVWYLAACSSILGLSAPAQAAPGSWSVGIERVFGFSRVSTKTEIADNTTVTTTSSQVSLFAHTTGVQVGYPAPRMALDYLFPSGLSLGGALGYQSVDLDADDDDDDAVKAWLLEPRVGYFASVTDGIGIWPRGGFTFVSIDTAGDDANATALSIEVPFAFRLAGNVCFVAMPYVDLGIGGGTDDVDSKVTEFGLQFGMNAFF